MAEVLYSFHTRQLARTRPAVFLRPATCRPAAASHMRTLCFSVMACQRQQKRFHAHPAIELPLPLPAP